MWRNLPLHLKYLLDWIPFIIIRIICFTLYFIITWIQSLSFVGKCIAFCKTDLKTDLQIKLSEIPSLSWLIGFVTVHLNWMKCVSLVLVNIGQKLLTHCILLCLWHVYRSILFSALDVYCADEYVLFSLTITHHLGLLRCAWLDTKIVRSCFNNYLNHHPE